MAGRPPTRTIVRDKQGNLYISFNECPSVSLAAVSTSLSALRQAGELSGSKVSQRGREITIMIPRPAWVRNDARTTSFNEWRKESEVIVKTMIIFIQKDSEQEIVRTVQKLKLAS